MQLLVNVSNVVVVWEGRRVRRDSQVMPFSPYGGRNLRVSSWRVSLASDRGVPVTSVRLTRVRQRDRPDKFIWK